MPDKTQELYEATLTVVADVVTDIGRNFRPGFRMVTDFELAERNAFKKVLDEKGIIAELTGYLFHFGQVLWRALGNCGLRRWYIADGDC